jgi:hypothetical protein
LIGELSRRHKLLKWDASLKFSMTFARFDNCGTASIPEQEHRHASSPKL